MKSVVDAGPVFVVKFELVTGAELMNDYVVGLVAVVVDSLNVVDVGETTAAVMEVFEVACVVDEPIVALVVVEPLYLIVVAKAEAMQPESSVDVEGEGGSLLKGEFCWEKGFDRGGG